MFACKVKNGQEEKKALSKHLLFLVQLTLKECTKKSAKNIYQKIIRLYKGFTIVKFATFFTISKLLPRLNYTFKNQLSDTVSLTLYNVLFYALVLFELSKLG